MYLGITTKIQKKKTLRNKIFTFSDASYRSDGSSICGISLILNGSAFHWRSYKLKNVITSASHAETEALAQATLDTIFFRNVITELGFNHMTFSTPLITDSSIAIVQSRVDSIPKKGRNYIRILNLIRQGLAHGETHLRYCSSENMVADLLTKIHFSSFKHFIYLRNALMGIEMKTAQWSYIDQLGDDPCVKI